ncbi:MAG TPA: GTP-binding protein [Roseiarcus sp.]
MGKTRVTILTGFLGAGKTTVLNHLLTQELGRGSAVIVNEFGEVSIDAQLVVGVEEDVVEINNGCICCTVRADLVSTIERLLARPRPIERILVETTGLADPAPIIQSFVLDETLRKETVLDGVVTVVDARHIGRWLSQGRRDEAEGRENTPAEQIAFADLLLLNKTDLVDEAALAECEDELRRLNPLAQILPISHGTVDAARVMDVAAFDLQKILRLEPGLLTDLDHSHDEAIVSVAVRPGAPLDREAFFHWLTRFTQAKGGDLLRVKGIIALEGERRRYVFHGVHMTLDGRPGRPWGDEEDRRGEIVFIGRRLDPAEIEAAVHRCVASAALRVVA